MLLLATLLTLAPQDDAPAAPTWTLAHTLEGHTGVVMQVDASPDGKWWASGSHDGTVRVWSAESAALAQAIEAHEGQVWALAFSTETKKTKLLASGGIDDHVRVWEPQRKGWVEKHELAKHGDDVFGVAFAPGGKTLASVSLDGLVRTWSTRSGKAEQDFRAHDFFNEFVDWSADGKRLVTGGNDGTVKVWDVKRAKEVWSWKEPGEAHPYSAAFSPDGRWLASGSTDATVRVWDTVEWNEVARLRGHTGMIKGVDFSADSTLLASAGGGGGVMVWRTSDWLAEATLKGHGGAVYDVAFGLPDGQVLVSGGHDKTVRVWRRGVPRDE